MPQAVESFEYSLQLAPLQERKWAERLQRTEVVTHVKNHWNPAVMDGDLAHVEDSADSFLSSVRRYST